ncbi:YdjY domain-containing protein [Tundrisphaera lichenicola]|uniref:YdjY domain-containing protein n=1 Tax=Tundrisphaera lichenicola TaxID=2029860 RepID=UPI003EBD990C
MLAALTLLSALVLATAPAQDPEAPPPPNDHFKPDPAWKALGQDIWFDPKGKVLILRARVALQDGALEHLICRKGTKEHESVLATEAPARIIHAGLLLTGATPGHPVRFQPAFEPPTGTPIAIEVEWLKDGKLQKTEAREWVKDQATGTALARDWVFAGSELFEDPRTKTMIYAADDGDLVTVANFPASILDLPFRSSANDADRTYLARADRVPVRGTPVTVYLRPRVAEPAGNAQPAPAAPNR